MIESSGGGWGPVSIGSEARSLLAYARERSPFHAARMANIDPATATIDDLTRLPPMLKQEAQNDWDAIITAPDITHARAEQVLAQQPWFSYTSAGYQISAPAAPAAYAVCTSGIGSSSSHSPVSPGDGRRVLSVLPDQISARRDSAYSRPASRHTPVHRYSTLLSM